MIKIAVVDDNQIHIDDVNILLKECMHSIEYSVTEYTNAESFIFEFVEKNFDMVFLDIVLDENDGIGIGMMINEKSPNTNIIFMSAYSEYFKEVYKVSHSYFLIKDFERERFEDAVKKALKSIYNNYLIFRIKNSVFRILLSDVSFIEGYFKHTILHMTDGTKKEYSIDLRRVEMQLPQNIFLRIHQSFIVNMNYISECSRQSVTVCDGTKIPISRSLSGSVREKITLFLGGAL